MQGNGPDEPSEARARSATAAGGPPEDGGPAGGAFDGEGLEVAGSQAGGPDAGGPERGGRAHAVGLPWRSPLAWVAAAALLLWLWVTLPLAAGTRTLYFRDVFSNHLPLKAFGARELAEGRVPALNPTLALGQPYRGNPSALAFYPGNLLYLALPFWSAFNLHYALHWLLAALTFFALARELGQGRAAALVAAITYAGSGWLLSCLSFYNLIAVAAWWPLAMWGAARGGRRGIALGGLACGMALLGGEPVTAALGMVPLLLVAGRRCTAEDEAPPPWRRRWVRALGVAFAIGLVGCAVALPQIVATARVHGFTYRGGHGMIASQAADYTLHPARWLELAIPYPLGRPLDVGSTGPWAQAWTPKVPFYFSLYAGIVALWLAAGAVRRRPAWAALAAISLLGAWLAGISGELLIALTRGLFRFPEKLLLWYALALPLLAGWGLERALARPRLRVRAAAFGAGAALLAAAAVAALRPAAVRHAEGLGRGEGPVTWAELVDAQLGLWLVGLLAAGALLAAAALVLARVRRPVRAAAALAALQLAALLQLAPLIATDATAPYRQAAPWLERVREIAGERSAAVFVQHQIYPQWRPHPQFRVPSGPRWTLERLTALDLVPSAGVLHGLRYPLYPDVEGLSSPLYTFLTVNLPRMEWPARLTWLRVLGVDAAVLYEDPGLPGLRVVDGTDRAGQRALLAAVEGEAPFAWWPERAEPAEGPLAALMRVPELDDPLATVVTSRPVEHRPGATVRVLRTEPDQIEVAVAGEGGVLAIRRSYQHLWRAHAGGRELPVFPLDLTLTGVEVPPGEHVVRLSVSDRPEALAMAGGSLAALLCVLAAWGGPWRRSRRPRRAGAPA